MPQGFILGAHQPHWLALPEFRDVPLMVSRRTLADRVSLPRAMTSWALDSGGFTELQLYGRWTVAAEDYVVEVRRFRDESGGMMWAAPQDWMCEPPVIHGLVVRRGKRPCPVCKKAERQLHGRPVTMRTVSLDAEERPALACLVCDFTTTGAPPKIPVAPWRAWALSAGPAMAASVATADKLGIDAVVLFHGTGLDVDEHQRRTVANLLHLRKLAPDLPFIPVLQGWTAPAYWRCQDLYEAAGVDLHAEKLVGVGTVCRRQGTSEATLIMRSLASGGLRLHGFGFKTLGLLESADDVASADSMAWSIEARRRPPLPGHDLPGDGRRTGHINCANCVEYALLWRDELLSKLARQRSRQFGLFDAVERGRAA